MRKAQKKYCGEVKHFALLQLMMQGCRKHEVATSAAEAGETDVAPLAMLLFHFATIPPISCTVADCWHGNS